ncbi:hypothetical protein P7C73_g2767, partial [Tremellales sp. Uapishka_1]
MSSLIGDKDEEHPTREDADLNYAEKASLEVPDQGEVVSPQEHHDLRRGLAQRHLSMMALAGAIGTGLFLSLGEALQSGGPLGALLGYGLVGLIVCVVQFALGEISAFLPLTGSFVRQADLLVDPALGFAVGWNIVYGNWLSIPSEISAICVLFEYWTDLNSSVFIVIFIAVTVAVGFSSVRVYGEVEFFFAILKILLIIGLILMGLVIDLGGVPSTSRIGFQYWKNPGPFVGDDSWSRFLGFWSVLISAVFSFSGVESIAMAAAETKNPRTAIPKACKRVFARVVVFYLLSILIVGMIVASNDDALNDESGTAAESPFVIVASKVGIKAIPSIVNAIVITSAWSSSNQSLLSGTRALYGLALRGQAPKLFLRTTKWGTPYMCVAIQTAFMFLAFMSLSNGALTVFYWFIDLVGSGVLISWIAVLVVHIRLIQAFRKQGIPPANLPWHNRWTPYASVVALAFCIILLLTNGYTVFTKGGWDTATFITAYLDIGLVAVAFVAWKIIKRTRLVKLEELPLQAILDHIDANPEEDDTPTTGWKKYLAMLWD